MLTQPLLDCLNYNVGCHPYRCQATSPAVPKEPGSGSALCGPPEMVREGHRTVTASPLREPGDFQKYCQHTASKHQRASTSCRGIQPDQDQS